MARTEVLRGFADRLRSTSRADVSLDQGRRLLYSTDASLYQIAPLAVVVPRTADDLYAAVRAAAEFDLPILPRGAATSLSGQTVGPAVVVDLSRHLNRVGVVDRDRMLVRVEPGLVLDDFNAHLKPLGLMFGPDVSTGDRATIGGMIGNNSAGARSLRYGKTVDHVEALELALDDGTPARFGPLSPEQLEAACGRDDRIGRLHRAVRDTVDQHREAITARFPHILRRVSGYNLDEFVPGLPVRPEGWPVVPWNFNLSRLIVGSEGTLAVVAAAEVRVVPRPAAQGLVVLSFSTIQAALERLEDILETQPTAVEMLDRMILDLAAGNPGMAPHLTFAAGRPEAVLAAQYYADSAAELADRANALARKFEGRPGVTGVRTTLSDAARDSFWKVRKAGLSLLMGMVGDAKPVAFVEDTAVAPQRLPEFFERFSRIVSRHGVRAACYGHADVGCLHIRPILNVKDPNEIDALRSIAAEVCELVSEFGGAMSGEHGDGLARSRWNRRLFGEEVYDAFRTVKRAFDPGNRMNPGKVVAEPDPGANLRLGPPYHFDEPATALDFSGQGGFARAVEMCSGVGVCRKTSTGSMCPSYMATRDEMHSTRGRANALRLAMSGQLGADGLHDPTLHEALDLCLQCKACKTECPSNVDMAKLKAEVLHQRYLTGPAPLGALLMGRVHLLNRIGTRMPGLANWFLRQPWMKRILETTAGIDRRRTLPTYEPVNLRRWFRDHPAGPRAGERGEVILLDDCFTTYNQTAPGIAAVRVLEAAGYRVRLAGIRCCGRAAISKGQLSLARELAAETVRLLIEPARRGIPILGVEPSCLLTLGDEYREFRLGPDAAVVASASRLVDTFVGDHQAVPELPLTAANRRVLVHGHCHQKSLVGTAGTLAALGRIPGITVQELDSGCCGMAGSFGYEQGHYEVSEALANRVLLPAMAADPEAMLAAPGFSCRSQVHGLSGAAAVHPMEILAAHLASP